MAGSWGFGHWWRGGRVVCLMGWSWETRRGLPLAVAADLTVEPFWRRETFRKGRAQTFDPFSIGVVCLGCKAAVLGEER